MQDSTVNDRIFFISGKQVPRSRENEILVPLSNNGAWKKIIKIIVDDCASHMTLFSIQALSLELAVEHRFGTLATRALKPRFIRSFHKERYLGT